MYCTVVAEFEKKIISNIKYTITHSQKIKEERITFTDDSVTACEQLTPNKFFQVAIYQTWRCSKK